MPNFEFDFTKWPSLSQETKAQIRAILRGLNGGGAALRRRTHLLGLILEKAYEPLVGSYMPIAENVFLTDKSPAFAQDISQDIDRFLNSTHQLELFTNALEMPRGGMKPKFRVINRGYLIITIECDSEIPEFLEEQFSWTRKSQSKRSKLQALDGRLARFRDYRGCTAVYSGVKSLHLHFTFSTEHLPFFRDDAFTEFLPDDWIKTDSAYMSAVHRFLWELVSTEFYNTMEPSVAAVDRQLKSPTQFRRLPFGRRRLSGESIDQFVVEEIWRTRAAPDASEFAVPPEFEHAPSAGSKMRPSNGRLPQNLEIASDILAFIREECRIEWGSEYPLPVHLERRDDGFWLFFKNHEGDTNPASFVGGDFRKLQLCGNHNFDREYFLPDDMSANELVEYCFHSCGYTPSDEKVVHQLALAPAKNEFRGYTPGWLEVLRTRPRIFGPRPIDIRPTFIGEPGLMMKNARDKLRSRMGQQMAWDADMIVVAPEGIGKTTNLLPILADEAMNRNRESSTNQRFSVVACRSHEQAAEKANHFREHTLGQALIVKSFNTLYREACEKHVTAPLTLEKGAPTAFDELLDAIRERQPDVFNSLIAQREGFYASHPLDAAFVVLFMSHSMAHYWPKSTRTRAWYNPTFNPSEASDFREAAKQMQLSLVVHDELELDELFHIIPATVAKEFKALQKGHTNWGNLPEAAQRAIYAQCLSARQSLCKEDTFDRFSELMGVDYRRLEKRKVDFDAIPYGTDQEDTGIYRPKHGAVYFIGPKIVFFEQQTQWIFLTTESLVAKALIELYRRKGERNRHRTRRKKSNMLAQVSLTDIPGVFPITVPLTIDPRATAPKRIDLVKQLRSNGYQVICDGTDAKDEGAINFQRMKGRNDLADQDIAIILTAHHPDVYAKLNVIGNYLGITDILSLHRQDQINQAVGRNRGFRNIEGTNITVYATRKTWAKELLKLPPGRTRFYLKKVAA